MKLLLTEKRKFNYVILALAAVTILVIAAGVFF